MAVFFFSAFFFRPRARRGAPQAEHAQPDLKGKRMLASSLRPHIRESALIKSAYALHHAYAAAAVC